MCSQLIDIKHRVTEMILKKTEITEASPVSVYHKSEASVLLCLLNIKTLCLCVQFNIK